MSLVHRLMTREGTMDLWLRHSSWLQESYVSSSLLLLVPGSFSILNAMVADIVKTLNFSLSLSPNHSFANFSDENYIKSYLDALNLTASTTFLTGIIQVKVGCVFEYIWIFLYCMEYEGVSLFCLDFWPRSMMFKAPVPHDSHSHDMSKSWNLFLHDISCIIFSFCQYNKNFCLNLSICSWLLQASPLWHLKILPL